jgi:hypothetical protein
VRDRLGCGRDERGRGGTRLEGWDGFVGYFAGIYCEFKDVLMQNAEKAFVKIWSNKRCFAFSSKFVIL